MRFRLMVPPRKDEPYRRHAETMCIQGILGCLDQLGVVGEAQVIVGTEVQYPLSAFKLNFGLLGGGDNAFGLK